jgi:hypothetical protein
VTAIHFRGAGGQAGRKIGVPSRRIKPNGT